MKYAIIGCGRVSPNHIKAALNNGLEIAALCDIRPEKAAALAEKFSIEAPVFGDYKKMLADINPELVSIATDSK